MSLACSPALCMLPVSIRLCLVILVMSSHALSLKCSSGVKERETERRRTRQSRRKLNTRCFALKTRPRELQNERAKKTTRTVLRVAQLPPLFSRKRKQSLLCSTANPQYIYGTELGPPSKAARLKLEQAVLSVFTTRTNTHRSKHLLFAFLITIHKVDPLQAWLVHSLSLTSRLLQRQEAWRRLWARAWNAAHKQVISFNSCGLAANLVNVVRTLGGTWIDPWCFEIHRYGRMELCGDEDRIWAHEAARLVRWRQVKRTRN